MSQEGGWAMVVVGGGDGDCGGGAGRRACGTEGEAVGCGGGIGRVKEAVEKEGRADGLFECGIGASDARRQRGG